MSDRKSKPRAVKDDKGKEKEKYTEDDIKDTPPAQEKIQSKKSTPPATLPTSSTNESSINKLIIDTDEPKQVLNMEKAVKQDELNQALGTLKRKQNDDEGLLILQEKVKILKLAKEMTGTTEPATNSNEFNFRLSKISKILTFYPPDKEEERIPDCK
jgi:hypothetical protein